MDGPSLAAAQPVGGGADQGAPAWAPALASALPSTPAVASQATAAPISASPQAASSTSSGLLDSGVLPALLLGGHRAALAMMLQNQKRDIAQQKANQTFQYLTKNGVQPQEAVYLSTNPTAMQAWFKDHLSAQQPAAPVSVGSGSTLVDPRTGNVIFQAPQTENLKFQKIGQDMLGQPTFGWVNPQTKTVTPVASAPNSLGGNPAAPDITVPYDKLPKAQQGMVDQMLAGKLPPPSSFALRSPYWITLLAAANERSQKEGNGPFDATIWMQRNTVARGFGSTTPNSYGGMYQSAEKIVNHSYDLLKLVPQLNNFTFGPDWLNSAYQGAETMGGNQKYQQTLNNAKQLAEGVAGEVSKFMTGGVGSEATRNEYRNKLDVSQKPSAIYGGLQGVAELMRGQLKSIVDQYNRAYGTHKTVFDFMKPETAKKFEEIMNASNETAKPRPTGAAPSTQQEQPAQSEGVVDYHTYFGSPAKTTPNGVVDYRTYFGAR